MEAAAIREVPVGTAERDACALVAADAEGLRVVAATAARVVLARGDRVEAEPIVRVYFARANPPVVAVRAALRGVAVGAEGPIVRRRLTVTLPPVGVVRSAFEPARRQQWSSVELGL